MGREEYQSLVKKFYIDIKRIAFSYCQNMEDAEDITQNVFIDYSARSAHAPKRVRRM